MNKDRIWVSEVWVKSERKWIENMNAAIDVLDYYERWGYAMNADILDLRDIDESNIKNKSFFP